MTVIQLCAEGVAKGCTVQTSAAGATGVAAAVIVVAVAVVILAALKAVVAAAVVVGEIVYPDHDDSDYHDDPEGLIALEEAEAFTIIAGTHKKDLPPK
ncbi:MAG: hypothetical protein IJE90_00680 [Clostridia bacterium]|nr:hypothetical protein [Clostridia bacterium]